MKNFETPTIMIIKFDKENIITDSAYVTPPALTPTTPDIDGGNIIFADSWKQ